MNKIANITAFQSCARLLLASLLVLIAMAGQGQVHYRLEGTIGDPTLNTKLLLFQSMTAMHMVNAPIDTLEIVDGKLIPTESTLDEPGSFYLMSITKDKEEPEIVSPVFIIEDGTHCIHFNPEKEEYKAPNTPLNKEFGDFVNAAVQLLHGDSAKQQRLDSLMSSTISRHNDDIIGMQSIAVVLSHVERTKVASWLDLLSPRIKAGNVQYEMRLGLSAMDLNMEPQERFYSPAVGEKFVDFTVEYDGKTTRLSDYVGRGKFVLVDFWASWCGPCRMEIPKIIATYNKYKDKGLEVIGIAAWDKPDASLEAIKNDGVPYPQIINTQEIATEAYNIHEIPHIILFAPDGTILARGVHIVDIEKSLAEAFEDG